MRKELDEYINTFNKILNLPGICWWIIDYQHEADYFYCNNFMVESFGLDKNLDKYSVDSCCPIAGDYNKKIDLAAKDANIAQKIFNDYEKLITQKVETYSNTFPYLNEKNNTVLHFSSRAAILDKDENDNISMLYGIIEDITSAKQAEEKLQASEKKLQAIIHNEPECVKLVDPQGNLTDINPAGLAMLEASSLDEAKSKSLISYLAPEGREGFLDLHKKVMNGESGKFVFKVKGLQGTERWLETHAAPMMENDGTVSSLLGITRDITKRKIDEEKISYMANYDTLTGLPNRAKLNEQFDYILNLAKRNNSHFALMFLDIDNFKNINDTLGHSTGDELLITIAERLSSSLREIDTVARLGGDEHIILLPDTSANEAEFIAQKILSLINKPIAIGKHKLNVSASIGISIFPHDGKDKDTLFKNADTAMYLAKNGGRNDFAFFTYEMQKQSHRNLELVNAMHQAIEKEEFHLVYQPLINLDSRQIIGAETLLRWEHPTLGSISPAEFIPIAEKSGLIISIGEWVIKEATKQFHSWINNGLAHIKLAVNLSSVQLQHSNTYNMITEYLTKNKIPIEQFELELTESAIMENPEFAIKTMNKFYDFGIRISIDDFGTGYSSLSYLKKFKVTKLKIDQSFIRDIMSDPDDRAIVDAVIIMSQSLGLLTVAEGVETPEQLEYLQERKCNIAQGYHFSKPLKTKEFEKFYYEFSKVLN